MVTRSGVLRVRKPIPLARSIRWVPAGLFTPPRAIDDLAVFITQGAIREVMRHLLSDPEQELLGFLLGELFECPETGARYVVINAAVPTGHVIPEASPIQIPEEEWLGLQLEVRRRRAALIGWYHSAPFVGQRPARLDLQTHRAHFTEPWQCGLVIALSHDAPAGGFFRPLLGEPEAGGVLIPFHELLDDDAVLESGRKRTLIDWVNYQTKEPVARDQSEQPPSPPPPGPTARAGADGAAPAGIGMAAGAGGAGPLPVMIPFPPELEEEMEEEEAPPPRRLRAGALTVLFLLGLVAAGGVYLWKQGQLPEPLANLANDVVTAMQRPAPGPASPPARPASDTPVPSTPSTTTAGGIPTPESASTGALGPASPPPTSDVALLRFDSLADSLSQAIRNFRDRSTDFSLQRLTCSGLAFGYRAADDALIALASLYRTVRDALDSTREARYRQLMQQMEGVNEEFDRSRCARP